MPKQYSFQTPVHFCTYSVKCEHELRSEIKPITLLMLPTYIVDDGFEVHNLTYQVTMNTDTACTKGPS